MITSFTLSPNNYSNKTVRTPGIILLSLCVLICVNGISAVNRSRRSLGLRPGPLPSTGGNSINVLSNKNRSNAITTSTVVCYYAGKKYSVGRFIIDGCVACECFDSGRLACSAKACTHFNNNQVSASTDSEQDPQSFVNHIELPKGQTTRVCHYNGHMYAPGQFNLNSCTTCECVVASTGSSATMTCTRKECPKVDQCIRYDDPIKGECCGECVEYGCMYNGTAYPRGGRVQGSACELCYCPWDSSTNGQVLCTAMACPFVACPNAVVPHGKCCPVCPNDSHCWFDDVMINAGEDIWLDTCHSCYCPPASGSTTTTTNNGGRRSAMCYKHTDC